jgi:steroid delta-isomerase-like uncharacterized protein
LIRNLDDLTLLAAVGRTLSRRLLSIAGASGTYGCKAAGAPGQPAAEAGRYMDIKLVNSVDQSREASMYSKCFVLLLMLAILFVGCSPSPSEQLEANKDLVRRFVDSLNEADWDALDSIIAEDFCRRSQASPVTVKSRADFKKLQQSFYTTMPDQKVTLEIVLAEDDKVAVYATYTGTMTGPMGGFEATGKTLTSKFLGIFRIEDNLIAELWIEMDNMAMFNQLGLSPASAIGS